jgi:Zn-dependent protease|tara:strand:- start:771 stop:1400 length:630 start_codon:yes stop_codon:yes gene_type:complete
MKFYLQPGKQIYIGKINTSDVELKDLVKAWLAISFAFAMVLRHSIPLSFYEVFIISTITVGTGFLLHELGHKIVAQRYGCFAEFRSFDQMLMIAIAMSFFGFVFAAPGAVMINGRVDKTKNGIISAAGPIVNLVLAFLFLSISMVTYAGLIKIIAFYGFFINSWLAMFNMIPVWNLDGAKVLKWNKKVYGIIVAVALLFLFLKNFISIA